MCIRNKVEYPPGVVTALNLIVVLGAAVRPDGSPSPSLARRIANAAVAARSEPEALIFCSGGQGRFGPSEASVIATGLRSSVPPAQLVLDEISKDTLQSVTAAVRFARANGVSRCIVCTDGYHLPRVTLLFWLLGVSCKAPASKLRPAGRLRYRLWMRFREIVAIPHDVVTILLQHDLS
jgi:uncharacterized SAM-binding protein YcdF (DUF218 family)